MVRVHPILSGEIRLRGMGPRRPRRGPAKFPRALSHAFIGRAHWYPVPLFLVEHPTSGPFLVDAGYDPSVGEDPARTLGLVFGKLAMKHQLAETTVAEAVSSRGIGPGDISLVVLTHLHLDHVSGSAQWPNATFLADRAERAAASAQRGPGPYVGKHLATIENWREVDFEGPESEPFESFTRTIDLFGDGSVRLISSPGHSPGHISVLLRLRDRFALLHGDAAMSVREIGDRVIDGIVLDQDDYVRSGDEARAFASAHPDTLVIPSHDTELWKELDPAYS